MTTLFEKFADLQPDRAPRRPQDHGPLNAVEQAERKEQLAITQSHVAAYDALCKRAPK